MDNAEISTEINNVKVEQAEEVLSNKIINGDHLIINSNNVEVLDNENQCNAEVTSDVIEQDSTENQTEMKIDNNSSTNPNYNYNWECDAKLICSATEEYLPSEQYENYTKGCYWSPDGTCLLVPSEDFRIRLFDLPKEFYTTKDPGNLQVEHFKSSLAIKEGGTIYDCCWYPYMDSWSPETCCFLSCSQESPVHLWDAFTGQLKATYRPYNQVDEVEPALSMQFINQGTEIWCGFKNILRTFNVNQPGRQISDIPFNKEFPNMSGLVSCIRENPVMPGLVAFGTYSKCIGLFKDGPICAFKTGNGVTQIEFSPCGLKLYTAVRRSKEFLCWDLRNPGTVLWSSDKRMSDTNQRIQFSLSFDGLNIVSGGTDGFVQIWESQKLESNSDELDPKHKWHISQDCVNGVNLHKSMPIVATTSGQRLCEDEVIRRDNSVRLWWCGY